MGDLAAKCLAQTAKGTEARAATNIRLTSH